MTFSEIMTMIVSSLTAIGVGFLAIWSSRQDQARNRLHERIDRADETGQRLDHRVTKVEGELNHVPNIGSITQFYDKLNDLSKSVAEINGAQKALLAILQRDSATKRTRSTDR